MTGYESTAELQQIETECLRRFRVKAGEIKAANPTMTAQIAFCKAVETLRQTADRYQFCRALLQERGIPAQPLR